MLMFKSIVVNGVRLVVYPDGTILRYSSKNQGDKLKKGWNILKGSINKLGYANLKIQKKVYKLHRILGNAFLGLDIDNTKQEIDHIDRNRQNNNLRNLRVVTHQQNQFNRIFKGYTWNPINKKYQSRIKLNNKSIHLGYFDTSEEAHQVYLDAKKIHHIIE